LRRNGGRQRLALSPHLRIDTAFAGQTLSRFLPQQSCPSPLPGQSRNGNAAHKKARGAIAPLAFLPNIGK